MGLEEVEQTVASAEEDASNVDPSTCTIRAARRRPNRGALPAHLPRIEVTVDIEAQACPCCQGSLHRIGEDVSERLDIAPVQLRVLVVRGPKYGCRACEEVVVQAPAQARLVEGGLPIDAAGSSIRKTKLAEAIRYALENLAISSACLRYSSALDITGA